MRVAYERSEKSKILNFIQQMLIKLYNLLEVLLVLVPTLLAVAFMTIIERKQLAAMQRRVGPNTVGYYGILQP
jgi:NADH:ubiquinone oxidoreductase subunit H